MAQLGHGAMSDLGPLSGEQPTWCTMRTALAIIGEAEFLRIKNAPLFIDDSDALHSLA